MYSFCVRNFVEWRDIARRCLLENVSPEKILWVSFHDQSGSLFAPEESREIFGGKPKGKKSAEIRVNRNISSLLDTVSCYRDVKKWALMYQLLWRSTLGKEKHLHQMASDPLIRILHGFEKEIRRDIHKMRAFVRFCKVGESAQNGREQFVAWFEPFHLIVEKNAPFFRDRFTGMNWSILTPDRCVHWDGEHLSFSDGVPRACAPEGDELEEMWQVYYKSIFNPARLKVKAMQTEMPQKYWENLPESACITNMIKNSELNTRSMLLRASGEDCL